jgi:hypothetical protein
MGEEHLLNAFVTSCQLESFFAVIDDVNRASNFISVTENRGQAMAIKSHTFMTAEERLRQEVRRRKKCKEAPMTREEAEAYLDLEPLAGWCTLTEEEKEYLYIQCEKTWYHDCRVTPKLQVADQHTKSLGKKRKRKEDKETTDAAKRTRFAAFENVPIYTNPQELETVLSEMYPPARDAQPLPKYSISMKVRSLLVCLLVYQFIIYLVYSIPRIYLSTYFSIYVCVYLSTCVSTYTFLLASFCLPHFTPVPFRLLKQTQIVAQQLNARKHVYGVSFPIGFLMSGKNDSSPTKLAALTKKLHEEMEKETRLPLTLRPPPIRAEYTLGVNPTQFRCQLDAERNIKTRAMEADFVRDFPGGEFPGHKCLYDYGRGKPVNPESINGQTVRKNFEEYGSFDGDIVEYDGARRWWTVRFTDDDEAQFNFRELCKFEVPPDFSFFRYTTDSPAASACAEAIANPTPDVTTPAGQDELWDLDDATWKLINVFHVEGVMLGAYCPAEDFIEEMGEQPRRLLITKNGTVEVAPLADIHSWIAASKEVKALQDAIDSGARPRRRRSTSVPRRKAKIMHKWTGAHDKNCVVCEKGGGDMPKCYGCNAVAHAECAKSEDQNNMLGLPSGVTRWACDICYFNTHGGGAD